MGEEVGALTSQHGAAEDPFFWCAPSTITAWPARCSDEDGLGGIEVSLEALEGIVLTEQMRDEGEWLSE